MKRRDILRGGAGVGAASLLAPAVLAAPRGADGLPMPPPATKLPPRPLVQDPSRASLDDGWRFHEGDIVPPAPTDHDATYRRIKAGLAIRFTIAGGTILDVGNGDPTSHESEKGGARSLFNGLAQVVVQADEGPGTLMIRAQAAGMRPATLAVDRPVPVVAR